MIFEDEEDSDKLLKILDIYKAGLNSSIYVYCFMYNHVQLFIRTGGEDIATFISFPVIFKIFCIIY